MRTRIFSRQKKSEKAKEEKKIYLVRGNWEIFFVCVCVASELMEHTSKHAHDISLWSKTFFFLLFNQIIGFRLNCFAFVFMSFPYANYDVDMSNFCLRLLLSTLDWLIHNEIKLFKAVERMFLTHWLTLERLFPLQTNR